MHRGDNQAPHPELHPLLPEENWGQGKGHTTAGFPASGGDDLLGAGQEKVPGGSGRGGPGWCLLSVYAPWYGLTLAAGRAWAQVAYEYVCAHCSIKGFPLKLRAK